MAITDGITNFLYQGGIVVVMLIVFGVVVILALALGGWLIFYKKRWNLKVEFKMTRSDGKAIMPEWGKGRFDSNNGTIWLKRNRKRAEAVKAKRLDIYLQGNNTITAVGNPGHWRIVIPESFLEVVDEETGETASLVKLKTDTKEDKSWAVNFERTGKATFTIQSFLEQYGRTLEMAFIILITVLSNFIGFSLVLGKLKGG